MYDECFYLKGVGNKIKEIRIQKGLTQLELSIDCKITLSKVGSIERGEGNPTIKTIKKICLILEVKPSEILD